ncbi:MAG: zinc-binding dehydrogenase [Candidatus Binatia bacterium]
MHRALLRAGETLLVHAAAGGVGLAAVQIGKALGARVVATAGGAEKLAIAREAGAEVCIDYREDPRDQGEPHPAEEHRGHRAPLGRRRDPRAGAYPRGVRRALPHVRGGNDSTRDLWALPARAGLGCTRRPRVAGGPTARSSSLPRARPRIAHGCKGSDPKVLLTVGATVREGAAVVSPSNAPETPCSSA